jgi:thiol-disulfide isomerase/thioredoxin
MFISKKSLRILATITFSWLLLSDPGVANSATKTDQMKRPQKPLPGLVGSNSFQGITNKAPLTVIQFWASWCTGCGTVMGQMTDLKQKNTKLGYVTVSLDESKDVAMKFFSNKQKKEKAALPVSYLDASGTGFAEPNGVDSLPYLIVVDQSGAVVKRIKGHPTKADLEFLAKN